MLVGNLTLSARLAHRNWKPCVHSKATLAACHSDGASCISNSFIVCTTLLMVGVPRMTEILVENPLGSSKTKTTCCLLWWGMPSIWTLIRVKPVGSTRSLPSPTSGMQSQKGLRKWSNSEIGRTPSPDIGWCHRVNSSSIIDEHPGGGPGCLRCCWVDSH